MSSLAGIRFQRGLDKSFAQVNCKLSGATFDLPRTLGRSGKSLGFARDSDGGFDPRKCLNLTKVPTCAGIVESLHFGESRVFPLGFVLDKIRSVVVVLVRHISEVFVDNLRHVICLRVNHPVILLR
jgi:hypothetical protein